VVSGLEAGVFGPVLVRGMTREDGRDVEDNRSLFKGQGVLRGRFVSKSVIPIVKCAILLAGFPQGRTFRSEKKSTLSIPGKRDLDVIFVHRKPQIQEFQLPIIPIQQIASCRTVLASTPHVLA